MISSIKRVIISVSDKTGLVEFARGLAELGIEIVSTGGTAIALRESNIPTVEVSSVTQFPEILDGRVKTLHPHIHGGILADLSDPKHVETLKMHGIEPFQMVVVNLYPFEQTVRQHPENLDLIIENIDIGGPSMIRAAAKNYRHVAVITDVNDYSRVIALLQSGQGKLPESFRFEMASKAFEHTAFYDALIAQFLVARREVRMEEGIVAMPELVTLPLRRTSILRYGENPHQQAARYQQPLQPDQSVMDARIHSGMDLSYNNILDAQAAWDVASSFRDPASAIIKHQSPCGVARAILLEDSYRLAYQSDPISAYGGIVALNRPVTIETARVINDTPFLELIIAPGYFQDALEVLKKKKNRRIMEMPANLTVQQFDVRYLGSGALIQERDVPDYINSQVRVVTDRHPTINELNDLDFTWQVVRNVKSNAIVLGRDGATVGIGAGQVSRVDSVFIACTKGAERVRGSVMASDAFFPFRDSIDLVASHGITAIVQPGGSKRDDEVIAACNEHGIAMIFSHRRHFRH